MSREAISSLMGHGSHDYWQICLIFEWFSPFEYAPYRFLRHTAAHIDHRPSGEGFYRLLHRAFHRDVTESTDYLIYC